MNPRVHGVAVAGLDTLRRHWLLAFLLACGILLRAIVTVTYTPVLFTITDSEWYLEQARDLEPSTLRPVGYSAFLRLLPLGVGLAVVPVVQHVLGILAALLVYAVLLRLGVRPWIAALATAPALLDAYLLNIEQQILAETLFDLLVVGACAALLWRLPLGPWAALLAGLLLVAAGLVRSIGVVIVVPVLLAVLLLPTSRGRVVTGLALLAAFAVGLAGYAVWFDSAHDRYALSSQNGRYLYGRVAQFADCDEFTPPPEERPLCPAQPVGERPTTQELMWSESSPVRDVEPPAGKTRDDVAGAFARRVIRKQPLGYARAVASDVLRGFAPTKTTGETDFPASPWKFQRDAVPFFRGVPCLPETTAETERASGCAWRSRRTQKALGVHGEGEAEANESLASFLRTYQSVGYVPGPLVAVGLLLGLVAIVLGGAGRRAPALLFVGLAAMLTVGSAAVSTFSWRYQLPLLFLVPAAAALGVTALLDRRRQNGE